ncbi:hypothetical protein DXA92_09735 [Agathobaculum butyriciproducens]|nr:hypothetical protein [Butyricicoccus sp. AF86-03b2A]RGC56125.1 hypothetical protein DXA94_08380 [Agathobaculum butyriciproducens]RGC60304.1 hypothetical protein DXA92_09735 [Agathobaculum butyriciproducens]
MITNEYGIHTFALKLRCKYSEIQNIIEQNECIRTGKGKLGLSPYYQMPQFKDVGVEIQLGQSVSHPCWLVLIVNPSSLFAGTYEPTALFQADKKSVQQIKHRLRNILDKIGIDRRLKEFKLSRYDLTCNLYYERKADIQDRLDIFKKSFPIPHYNTVKFGEYSNSDERFKGANKHSWTIENKSKSCAFSVYDKSYELEKRHNIKIDEHILRLELRFGRSKITKMTKAKDWYGQLIELSKQVEKQQSKFLHRLHMTYFDPVPLSELLDRIDASKYHKKTKKMMRRIAKKANGCVSLAAVRKDCRIKKSDFIKLLGKFEEMGVGGISFKQ